jgi:hypothetical protein
MGSFKTVKENVRGSVKGKEICQMVGPARKCQQGCRMCGWDCPGSRRTTFFVLAKHVDAEE